MQEEKLKLDDNVLPREIQRIIGNEYFFELHLDEYNLKYGRENYTVSKILETEISHKVERDQDTIEEIVRKSRKGKSIANQKIEIGQTSVERPQLIAAVTTKVEETDDKSVPLQMLQKHQKGTKQIASKKKKKFEV
ncbi:uncharacterized protein LOC142606855 [Castanea sativa]|uniref:uncharacterized protein LOC142606855 n=1 Tax=Castanea sativa TaxID=21020 RepID=UPI003F64C96A